MAVALDTYSNGGIHPKNKQLPSKRLSVAGLNIAYGMANHSTNGPFPKIWDFTQLDDGYQGTDYL